MHRYHLKYFSTLKMEKLITCRANLFSRQRSGSSSSLAKISCIIKEIMIFVMYLEQYTFN